MDCRRQRWRCPNRLAGSALVVGLLSLTWQVPAAEVLTPYGPPAVGRNADGVLEVFRVGPDGVLQHRWQKKSNGDWSAWSSLGASFEPDVAVATNGKGEMEVFAVERGSRQLLRIHQVGSNSPDWSTWATIGGGVAPPLAVAQNADGRIEVFALGLDGLTLKHFWQTDAAGGWSGPEDLGGRLASGVVTASNSDGRLELFGVDARDQTLVHSYELKANRDRKWSPWTSLGGCVLPGLAAARNARGVLEVFAVNATNGLVQRIRQNLPGNSETWSPWQDFGSNMKPALATGQSADGRIEIFAVAREDGTLLHRWEILTDGSDKWSVWASLGAKTEPPIAVAANEDGNLEVFAKDPTAPEVLNHRRQISQASDWLDWSSMDHTTFDYNSRTWQVDEGLPNNSVQAVAQMRDGYLWIGTRNGLARFDGVNFTVFNDRTTPALKTASVAALCADQDGALWIGTDGGGLARLRDGIFTHFGTADGLAGDVVKVVYQGKDGALWIGTTNGISRYSSGRFTTYRRSQGLLSDVVSHIREDREGYLWIATGAGLNRLSGDKMDAFEMPNGLPNDSVRGICQDRAGRLWIGSNNGMLWFNAYWKSFYAYNTRYGLSDAFVSAICDDREGNLWVGTYSGLNRFREGRFFTELDNEGVPFGKINTLFEDREANLWVGSEDGLVRLTPRRFITYTQRQGLTHNNVMSVLEDRSGSLWVGTWGGGLDQLKEERVTPYHGTNIFAQNLVLALCEGRDGSMWAGQDFDAGLVQIKNGEVRHYKDGLIPAPIRVLHQDATGALWVGTTRGLSCLRDGRFASFTSQDGLANDSVRAICETHDGNLWFGTEGGLSRLNTQVSEPSAPPPTGITASRNSDCFTTIEGLSDPHVRALYEDAQGTLWIGTAAGGLNRYHQGRLKVYTTRQGLWSDEVFEILEDDQGWLWMSCSKGVFRVRKADFDALDNGTAASLSSLAYGRSDGMETTQCNGAAKPGSWKSRDGRLWFATSKGLAAINPVTARINNVPPPVFIEEVLADRRPVAIERRQPRQSAPGGAAAPQQTSLVTVAPGRGELEFHFTALNLQAPEESRFKYKLENVDADWMEAGTRRTAHYVNVYPGQYQFRVMACNKDGIWNETGASLDIVLRPHLWQIGWLRVGAGLAVIGLASGSARYVTRHRMQRKLVLAEQRHAIEKERGRIAKDIHDDLGSSLTRIMMLGERAEEGLANKEEVGVHVGKIVVSARRTVQALDEIVWAVNPENDTLDGLVEYLSHYADEFFGNTNVSCRLEIPVQLPALTLSAEVRHDLFLVVKEAFNNVLKHAKATEVQVQVSCEQSKLEIVVGDNGCGFDEAQNPGGRMGNGLHNMRKRIENLGGTFEIASAPGKGTRLVLTAVVSQAVI